jgi:threonine/homoserine/homoserine lactone efflux protein
MISDVARASRSIHIDVHRLWLYSRAGPFADRIADASAREARRAIVCSLGALLQIGVVALGAVAILKTSPVLYSVLKVLGGAYLIWLGVQRIRTRYTDRDAAIDVPNNVLLSSALIEASNPKSALFYFSFLVQFTDPSASVGLGWQLFLLGACANLLFSAADIFCIVLAHPLRTRIAPGGGAMRIGQPLAGALFIVLGVVAILGD